MPETSTDRRQNELLFLANDFLRAVDKDSSIAALLVPMTVRGRKVTIRVELYED